MENPNGLWLMTNESATIDNVSSALGLNGNLRADCVCRDVRELVRRLQDVAASAVLVDLDPSPRRMLSDLEPIVSRFVDTRFIVLSEEFQSDLVLEAMQIGARHFLVKHTIEAELAGVLERLTSPGTGNRKSKGTAVTVLSASGGSGSTTVAVNLANELALSTGQTSLLIDLDYCYGAVATFLGVEAKYGIADVLVSSGRIDDHLITSTAVGCWDHLQVLVSPATSKPTHAGTLDDQNLDRTLDICKRTYAQTVIDAPRVSADVAASLAQGCTLTLIVLQLTIKDLHVAKAMLSDLRGRGVAPDALLPLVNRYQKRGPMIPLQEAKAVLGDIPVECIRNDFRSAVSAINFGLPLAQVAPRSALCRDLAKLTSRLTHPQAVQNHVMH